jgi:hypothetical protein
MLAHHGRRTLVLAGLLAGLLAAGVSVSVSAQEPVTTQQVALGQAASQLAPQQAGMTAPQDFQAVDRAPPALVQENYATEATGTTGRPLNLETGSRARLPVRTVGQDSRATRFVAASRRSSCAHLGCRGVHVLGVGY